MTHKDTYNKYRAMNGHPIVPPGTQKKEDNKATVPRPQEGRNGDNPYAGHTTVARNTMGPAGQETISTEKPNKNRKRTTSSLEEDPDGDYHDDGPARNAGRSLNAGGSGRPNKKQKRSEQDPDADYQDGSASNITQSAFAQAAYATTEVGAARNTTQSTPTQVAHATAQVESTSNIAQSAPAQAAYATTQVESASNTTQSAPAPVAQATTQVGTASNIAQSAPAQAAYATTQVESASNTTQSAPAPVAQATTQVESASNTTQSAPAPVAQATTQVGTASNTAQSAPAQAAQATAQVGPVQAPQVQIPVQQGNQTWINPDDDGLNNRTSLVEGQEDWSVDNLPEILYVFDEPEEHRKPGPRPTETKMIHGSKQTVFPVLPDNISSEVEEFRVEAWLRLDGRIKLADLTNRMHPDFRIENNALQMRGARFRQAFNMLAWGSTNAKTEVTRGRLVEKLIKHEVEDMTSTRGLTPGLKDPTLGLAGGEIKVPTAYRRKWEQQAADEWNSRNPPLIFNLPADNQASDDHADDDSEEDANGVGQAPPGTVRPADLGPINDGDEWLGLGFASENDEPDDEAAHQYRQAELSQEDIDSLFTPDKHARDYAAERGIDLDMMDVPAPEDPEAEKEAEDIESMLENFIEKQRERNGPLRNLRNLPYIRSLLALHMY